MEEAEKWQLEKKLEGQRWNPSKKISQEQMEALKLLKFNFPELSASDLAERFKISPEAVRRILKSNWRRTDDENKNANERWKRRGERIKEMYEKTEGTELVYNRIINGRKLVVGSSADASELIAKSVHTSRHFKRDTVAPEKNSTNKLYLLKRLSSKQ